MLLYRLITFFGIFLTIGNVFVNKFGKSVVNLAFYGILIDMFNVMKFKFGQMYVSFLFKISSGAHAQTHLIQRRFR